MSLWHSIPANGPDDHSVEWIATQAATARVTLGEGRTPLIPARNLGRKYGLPRLQLKLESVSPTGSYKDRFAAAAVSAMLASGQTHCVATSSGNTGAALAAYCAAAQIRCSIAVVESAPLEKLQQMLVYGARLLKVRGFGTDPQVTQQVFHSMERAGRADGTALQISAYHFSPAGMSGVQSISYELADTPVQHLFVPAGGGGLALAVVRGFQKLVAARRRSVSPAVHVVQPEGNDTIATPLAEGHASARDVQCTSAISGLQVASVIDGNELVREARACGGTGIVVSDQEVWRVQAELSRLEGVFCEPAAAVSVAGAIKAASNGLIPAESEIVCLITGSGFKDQTAVNRLVAESSVPVLDPEQLETQLTAG